MGQESQDTDSVFDFLYVDHVRIAVLASQLGQHGHLESVKVTDEARETFKKSGSANVLALKGKLESEQGTNEKAERSYNPLWLHARQFLDIFDELGYVQRDLSQAGYGDLVVVSGSLTVTDPRFMQPLWRQIMTAIPEMKQAVAEGFSKGTSLSRQQRRAASRKSQSPPPPTPSPASRPAADFMGVVAGFLEGMPHAVRGRLSSGDEVLWFMLVPERMSVTPEEIVLKHGSAVPGKWHVAGIVDAIPGEETAAAPTSDSIGEAVNAATSALQDQMGRPKTDYGITPLLIFRQLGSNGR